MKITDHDAFLVRCNTDDPVLEINRMARVCYSSTVPIADRARLDKFVGTLIRERHESPLEFVDFTFMVHTDRGVTHELVRHRLASYQQESTRYVKFKELEVVQPADLDDSGDAFAFWVSACEAAEKAYLAMLSDGVSAQTARSVLPTCAATSIAVKMNLRELRHFLKLRLSPDAHPDMRVVAGKLYDAVLSGVRGGDTLLAGIAR